LNFKNFYLIDSSVLYSTYQRILKANRHIDEHAAKVLLERSLVFENGALDFGRDINIPKFVTIYESSI
jgi:hypothetical protein